MIKFFRKIRQNMIKENKFSKYLLYGIGEIILVVIGILIALQINNWNQDRIQLKQEHKLLLSLHSDFSESKVRLLESIYMQKNVVRKSKELIKIYEGKIPRPSNDSIMNYIAYGAQTWYRAELLSGAYDAFINSGNSELLRNEELTKMLAEFYSIVKSGFEDQENSMNLLNNMNNIIAPVSVQLELPLSRKLVGLDTIRSPNENKAIDFLFKQDAYFGNLMNRVVLEYLRLSIQEEMLDKINQTLTVLNQELKSHND